MKYGVFWDIGAELNKRKRKPYTNCLPKECCAHCINWIPINRYPYDGSVGCCTKECTFDYDFFSWADDLCNKFDRDIKPEPALNWMPLTKTTRLINGRQYLIARDNDSSVEVGEYYVGNENEYFIVWGMCEDISDYDFIAEIYLPEEQIKNIMGVDI